jgi:hypothetical protein
MLCRLVIGFVVRPFDYAHALRFLKGKTLTVLSELDPFDYAEGRS